MLPLNVHLNLIKLRRTLNVVLGTFYSYCVIYLTGPPGTIRITSYNDKVVSTRLLPCLGKYCVMKKHILVLLI